MSGEPPVGVLLEKDESKDLLRRFLMHDPNKPYHQNYLTTSLLFLVGMRARWQV